MPEPSTTTADAGSFTAAGVRAGALAALALVPGVLLYGGAFGVLAAAHGLSRLEAAFFSAWVNAGGAQMAVLQAWSEPLPVAAMVLTTLAMNSRYLLLGAALRPSFGGLPAQRIYPALFVMGDGNWALTVREQAAGRHDAGFLVGSGVCMWIAWNASTVAGHAFGSLLAQPERYGIDFVLSAFFACIAVGFFRGAASLAPLAAGAVAAIVAQALGAGAWSLLVGAACGSAVALVVPGELA